MNSVCIDKRALIALIICTALAWVPVAHAGELVINGSFETGDFGAAWVHGAFRGGSTNPNLADHVVVPDLPFTGSYSALLGFKYTVQRRNAAGFMYQDVAIPNNISSAQLFFKVRQQGYDSTPYDPFRAQIRQTDDTVLQTVLLQTFPEYNNQFKDSGWLDDDDSPPVGFDMMAFAGQIVRLYFEQANTIDALFETWAFVDDVSLIYRRFVDLAVLGDGDDIFGALGSGAGGVGASSGLVTDTLSFSITVENEGVDSDSYTLSLNTPAGWVAWIDDGGAQALPFVTPIMTAGSTNTYTVFVTPATGTTAGTYDLIFDAESTTQGNRFDSATLRAVLTDATFGTDLVVDGNGFGAVGDNGTGGFALKESPRDSVVTYTIELFNTGDAATDYQVDWTTEVGASVTIVVGGTPFTIPFTTANIAPGGSIVMTLEVEVPSPNAGGDYETIVQAVASADPQKRDSIRAILRVRAPKVDVIIGASGDDIYDDTGSGLGGASSLAGARNTQVAFPVVVENESALADSFQLTWVPPGAGWTAVLEVSGVDQAFPFTTAALQAFSQKTYALKVLIPGGAAFGTYLSLLNTMSLVDNNITESVTASISVADPGQVDMVIDGSGSGVYGPIGTGLGGSSIQTLEPGDSVTFSIDLQNIVGTDSIDVMWNTPPGWQVTFDGQTSPVLGIQAAVYEFKAVVPATSLGGTFDLIVDAQKTDKPFYMDSVLGRVVVTPVAIVDGLIDGNGDDIFGATGTGLGGLSSQTHSAPAIFNFTVELQNQGGLIDDYTVSWNTPPGLTATLNGASSPTTTGAVAVGSSVLMTFQVTAPPGAVATVYTHIIDVVSAVDVSIVESIAAEVTIVGPPRADLLIDGNGTGVFGALGTGDGGFSIRGANAGGNYNASLVVRNAGSFSDSFLVSWTSPAGWPVNSVVISNGTTDYTAPFHTVLIGPSAAQGLTVKVQVPAGATVGDFATIIDASSSLPPNSPESIRLTTQTAAVVRGTVFEDLDHDGVLTPGDVGLSGVSVTEQSTGSITESGGGGQYTLHIAGGTGLTIIERNPSGFVSLSPDTVGPVTLNGGDTLIVDFADVKPLRLSAGAALTGVAGRFIDFPHRIDVDTRGPIVLTATPSPSVVTMFMFDENANGVFDSLDRALQPADLDMDPSLGKSTASIFLRVFVPSSLTPGTTIRVVVDAGQTITGTSLTTSAQATDVLLVVESSAGRVTMRKEVDLADAMPGDVLTYTISFFNPGVDSVQNILVLDPVSPHVDPVPDAFGPGLDVEWTTSSGIQFLTLDPSDIDECEYSPTERLLRLFFSKNTAYFLPPGDGGRLSYKVIVK